MNRSSCWRNITSFIDRSRNHGITLGEKNICPNKWISSLNFVPMWFWVQWMTSQPIIFYYQVSLLYFPFFCKIQRVSTSPYLIQLFYNSHCLQGNNFVGSLPRSGKIFLVILLGLYFVCGNIFGFHCRVTLTTENNILTVPEAFRLPMKTPVCDLPYF